MLALPDGHELVASIDTMVEGRHFPAGVFPEDIAYRAVAAAASDLAAMGAQPLGMTLALTLPDTDALWLRAFSEGVAQAVSAYGLPLVGGDTTRGPLTISVQVLGSVEQGEALLRSGAREGDRLCVSGTLGDAAAALALEQGSITAEPDDADYLLQRFYRPTSRLSLARALVGQATACIDISDGLLADAGHIADASGVMIQIDSAALPLSPALSKSSNKDQVIRWALSGGDDYELCFCLPEAVPVPAGCTVVGSVLAGEGISCDVDVSELFGFDHFR